MKEREYKEFNEGLNSKVKLSLCITSPFVIKEIKFKNYGLDEELGRHRSRNDDGQCKLCGEECESVVHVLWECPVYDTITNTFMGELNNLLEGVGDF